MTAQPPGEDPTLTAADSAPPSSSLHGRFDPGTRLGTRYRVVGLLGRGGMGEVYRADDLELNQPVALKFLPEHVARNPADLARLRKEVRVARQIAHPNVCRTYDIAEAAGQYFVVMEYVDGEDLSSALRRLGRPSPDKALEIARQLCLGLGAAHENGVLHRDLKPANIMIDGRGRVRITDFGLAGTAEEIAAESGAAGTPGYMAPEQEESGGATVQSDIYSLGLALYEIFTGRRASEMKLPQDPSRPGSESGVRTPSSLVAGIDAAVEHTILRCLERDPARRFQSAYAILGALPGGDPLAAALAAGETPSPELVANAGGEGTVHPLVAGLAIAAVVVGLLAVSMVQRPLYEGFGLPAPILSTRAMEILLKASGNAAPRYSDRGYRYAPTPGTEMQFWKRWSPVPLVSTDIHSQPSIGDPPQAYPGSATVVLDTGGRLLGLSILPTLSDSVSGPAAVRKTDWDGLLRAAGREPARAIPMTPPVDFAARADSLAAWRIPGAGGRDTVITAASFHGQVVEMETRAGGHRISRVEPPPWDDRIPVSVLADFLLLTVIPFFGSIILAWRNLKAGRGDVRGALVVGIAVALLYHPRYVFSAYETGFIRILAELIAGIPAGHALIHGVGMAIAYLAIEPYVRRLWPSVLVGWARLVAGRWRDPIVGRAVLAGALSGALGAIAFRSYGSVARILGVVAEPPQIGPLALPLVLDAKAILGAMSVMLAVAMVRTLTFFTILVILRYVFRNNRAAVAGVAVIYFASLLMYVPETGVKPTWLLVPFVLANVLIAMFLTFRYGFAAAVTMYFFAQIVRGLPWTSDLGTWFAAQTQLSWVIVALILGFAYVVAVGRRSLLRDPLGDPAAR